MNITERLKRLEASAKRLIVNIFPPDNDDFVHALVGNRAEQYRRDTGYDVMAVLNDTARQDWTEETEN